MQTSEQPHPGIGYKGPVYVFCALIALTVLTVSVGITNLSPVLGITAAMGIALVKASLVVVFFMHLKYESRLFWYLVLLVAVTFLIIMALTFTDYAGRAGLFQ